MEARKYILSFALCMVAVLVCSIFSVHAAANLVVSSVSGPTEAFLNQTIPVTYVVKNHGDAVSGAYEVELYLSTDKTIKPDSDYLLMKVSFAKGLAAGQVRKTTARVIVPNSYLHGLPGDYYYGAVVESSKQSSLNQVAIVRYKDNGDGTVTDFKTGLMWQQTEDSVTRTWADAKTYCDGLVLGGHDDWSLPPGDALQKIVDYTRTFPSINPVFNGRSTYDNVYWSSTACAVDPGCAATVLFFYGDVSGSSKTDYKYYVRCVREGP